MTVERVAVGILVNDKNKVFIAKRSSDKHQGGKWEFPGGKLEKGETSYQALCREMREEIGIEVQSATLLTEMTYHYKEKTVSLDFYRINKWLGTAQGMEQQPVRWVEKSDLDNYEFPEANLVLQQYCIDGYSESESG